MSTIAILHPGQMGAEVGRALVESGHEVCWLPSGRSLETRRRAEEAGLVAKGDIRDCDIAISVCPPAAAVELAKSVDGFRGLYVDANAVGPATARVVAETVGGLGATYVDGGIVGPPPARAGSTRLYLSGASAGRVAALFADSRVDARVLGGEGFAASALKMTYGAWTKVTASLLVSIRASARELGVEESLVEEWGLSQPRLNDRYSDALDDLVHKGWRWRDEMLEVSRTFAACGEPAGFAEGAAQVCARWPRRAAE